MMHDLRPYPVYKDSGAPWLGEVPENWGIQNLGSLIKTRSQRGRPDLPLLSVVREKGVVLRTSMSEEENHNFVPDDLSNYKVVHTGDLVINKMKAWQGSLGLAPEDGIVSPAYFVFDFSINNRKFGQSLLRSKPYVSFFAQASDGVRIGQWDLSPEGMKRIPVVIPSPDEQSAIVRFIDHADRRIRRYIVAKQKLIKLLEEEKQSVIHHAITRGLDSNARLKPSGIDFIEDIPEHWRVVALKWVLRRLIDCEHKTAPAVDSSEFLVVRTTAVRNGSLRFSGTYCTSETGFRDWTRRGLPEPGDVVFTREAPAGEACLVPEDVRVCLGQRTVLMKLNKALYDPQFLIHMIYAGPPRVRIRLASQGSTVGHFNMDDIGSMYVLAPPLHEQRRIVAKIKGATKDLTLALEAADREITLLREYRVRLIADVVTGKLDVRDAASHLPDETEEPDELLSLEGEEDPELMMSEELAEEEVTA